ncbi:hypothetical protein AGMMS4957_06710 [Bacteroidia bacterium]|nr:hypothetical protein AGMMS4957_06710 [Bacteroidia bacterium]
MIGRETFAYYILPELSSYVLVNRINKDIEAQRDAIKEMFLNLFDFDTDL